MISPPVAAAWSAALLAGVALSVNGMQQVLLCGAAVASVFVATRSTRVLIRGLWLTGPVILILLGVHGFISPLFPVTGSLGGVIPVRGEGIAYAIELAQMIFVVTFAALLWLGVSRTDFIDDLIWLHTPPIGIAIAGQTIATLGLLGRKIATVFLAQRARGIPVEGRFLGRVRALPSVLVPVVAVTLIEADARSLQLQGRGLGVGRLSPVRSRRFGLGEAVALVSLPVLLTALLTASR